MYVTAAVFLVALRSELIAVQEDLSLAAEQSYVLERLHGLSSPALSQQTPFLHNIRAEHSTVVCGRSLPNAQRWECRVSNMCAEGSSFRMSSGVEHL